MISCQHNKTESFFLCMRVLGPSTLEAHACINASNNPSKNFALLCPCVFKGLCVLLKIKMYKPYNCCMV